MAGNPFVLPVTAFLTAVLLGACNEGSLPQDSAAQPRPVKVLKLSEQDFRHESSLTGSVSLYREQRIGFEVGGRILSVLDVGLEVTGPALDEAGVLVRPGDLIAVVDDTRYRLEVETLQARLDSEN